LSISHLSQGEYADYEAFVGSIGSQMAGLDGPIETLIGITLLSLLSIPSTHKLESRPQPPQTV